MRNLSAKVLSLIIESTPNYIVEKYYSGIVPIFMLHRLCDRNHTQEREYIKHIKWCLNYIRVHNYTPISLNELIDAYVKGEPIPPKSVVFTIDDGFYDQYEIGAKLFSEYDIPLTCFVITDFLDELLWPWDDQIAYAIDKTRFDKINIKLPNGQLQELNLNPLVKLDSIDLLRGAIKVQDQTSLYSWVSEFYEMLNVDRPVIAPDDFRAMSWSDAQKFIDMGHHIAPHTKTHRILSQLDNEDAKFEILQSQVRVHEKLRGASDVFAYPTGRVEDYNEENKSVIKESSLVCSVDTQPGHFKLSSDLYSIPRFSLPTDKFNFIQYLSFFEEFKSKLRN